jgi:formate-dependent nitrite reductase membrane component NrfD
MSGNQLVDDLRVEHAPGKSRPRVRTGRGETAMVPKAEFRSYYGRPILKTPTWKALDIAGYLFVGGLAGASSAMAAGAQLTGRPTLARRGKVGALVAISLGAVGLVHDLGRPARFANMLRVLKPTSPMSIGSWLLAAYGPAAGVAAGTSVLGRSPRLGKAATLGAGLLGPAVASYTSVLIADTAAPAWHEARAELPFIFVGSAAAAAGGLGMVVAPSSEVQPAARVGVVGAMAEIIGLQLMKRRIGMIAETYDEGRAGALLKAGEALTALGVLAAVFGRRSRAAAAVAGVSLTAASACSRFGIFEAGKASAADPKYTVVPQRESAGQSAGQTAREIAGRSAGDTK